jgi:hypothetical protein
MWLKRKATLKEGDQGCAVCKYYNRHNEDVHLRCGIIERVVKVHGWMPFSVWIQGPDNPNLCSLYVNDPVKTKHYKEDVTYENWMKGKAPVVETETILEPKPEEIPEVKPIVDLEPKPPEDITPKTSRRLWLRMSFSDIDEPYKTIVEQAGGKYLGIRSGGEGYPFNVWFNHPQFGSTAMLPVTEITVENVKRELDDMERRFSPVK